MSDRFTGIPVVTFFTIMAVSARGVVPASYTYPTASAAAQFEKFHVETAFSGVEIAIAG